MVTKGVTALCVAHRDLFNPAHVGMDNSVDEVINGALDFRNQSCA